MASISSASASPTLHFPNPKISSSFPLRSPSSLPFSSHPHHSLSADAIALCRCLNPASGSPSPSDNSVNRGWDSMLQDVVRNGNKRFDSYMNSLRNEALGAGKTASVVEKDGSEKENREPEDQKWDWDRWRKHFQDVDEQEHLISILKVGDVVLVQDESVIENEFRLVGLETLVHCGVRGSLEPPCNAVGYIDRFILGEHHMYQRPVYRRTKVNLIITATWNAPAI